MHRPAADGQANRVQDAAQVIRWLAFLERIEEVAVDYADCDRSNNESGEEAEVPARVADSKRSPRCGGAAWPELVGMARDISRRNRCRRPALQQGIPCDRSGQPRHKGPSAIGPAMSSGHDQIDSPAVGQAGRNSPEPPKYLRSPRSKRRQIARYWKSLRHITLPTDHQRALAPPDATLAREEGPVVSGPSASHARTGWQRHRPHGNPFR